VPGAISGFAYIDQNQNGVRDSGETGINNVVITLSPGATTTTGSDGSYSFLNLSGGIYSVAAPPVAAGLGRVTPSPLWVTLPAGGVQPNVNFGYFGGPFVTFTIGGWGTNPSGNNPGTILRDNFSRVYPSGVTVGGSPYYLKFTSSSAIATFLPNGGTAGVLKATAINPTSSGAGVFCSQVLGLKLSVDFSAAGVLTPGLGAMRVAPGNPLAGWTVNQVLALANNVLAGNLSALPAGMTVSTLNDVVARMNENYDNGTTNNGFLMR
jgi:hypothetical protein